MRGIHFSVFMSLLLSAASMDAFASALHDEKNEDSLNTTTPRKRSKSTKTQQAISNATIGTEESKTEVPSYDVLSHSAKELREKEEALKHTLSDLQTDEDKAKSELKTLKAQLAAFEMVRFSEQVDAWKLKITEAKKQKTAIEDQIEDIEGQIRGVSMKAEAATKEAEKCLLAEWDNVPLLPVHYKGNAASLTFTHILAMMRPIILSGDKGWDDYVFEAEDDAHAYRFSLAFDDFKRDTYFDVKNLQSTIAAYYEAAHAIQGIYTVHYDRSITSKAGHLEGEEVLTHHYSIQDVDAGNKIVDRFFIALASKPAEQNRTEKDRGKDLMQLEVGSSAAKKALKTLVSSYAVPETWGHIFESFVKAKKDEKVEVRGPALTYHQLWHLTNGQMFIRKGNKPSLTIVTDEYNITIKLGHMSHFEDLKPSDYINFDQCTWSPAKTVNGEISVPHLTMHYAVYSNTKERRTVLSDQFDTRSDKQIDIVIAPKQKKKKDGPRESTLDVKKVQKSMRGEETSLRSQMVALRKQTSELRLLRKSSTSGMQDGSSGAMSPKGSEMHSDVQLEKSLAFLDLNDDQTSSSSSPVTSPKTPRKSSGPKTGLLKKQNDPKSIPEESEDASSSVE